MRVSKQWQQVARSNVIWKNHVSAIFMNDIFQWHNECKQIATDEIHYWYMIFRELFVFPIYKSTMSLDKFNEWNKKDEDVEELSDGKDSSVVCENSDTDDNEKDEEEDENDDDNEDDEDDEEDKDSDQSEEDPDWESDGSIHLYTLPKTQSDEDDDQIIRQAKLAVILSIMDNKVDCWSGKVIISRSDINKQIQESTPITFGAFCLVNLFQCYNKVEALVGRKGDLGVSPDMLVSEPFCLFQEMDENFDDLDQDEWSWVSREAHYQWVPVLYNAGSKYYDYRFRALYLPSEKQMVVERMERVTYC